MAEPEPEDQAWKAVVAVEVLNTTLAEVIVALSEGSTSQSIYICNRGNGKLSRFHL